jgi:hypothetical protein
MKIHHLLDGISIAITNEERKFINTHHKEIPLSALDAHDTWLAQNLVRKDVYKLTNDNKYIVINRGQESNNSTL